MANLLQKTAYVATVPVETYHEVMVELTRPDTSDPEYPGLVESRIETVSLLNNGQPLGPRLRQMVEFAAAFEGWTLSSWWTAEPTNEF